MPSADAELELGSGPHAAAVLHVLSDQGERGRELIRAESPAGEQRHATAAQRSGLTAAPQSADQDLGGAVLVDVSRQAEADAELSGALSRLLVVVENYPEIRSSENFQQLSDELAGTENRIAVARQDYNGSVTEFNREVRSFPGNMVAGIFGFDEKEYFEADAGAEDAPDVDFGTDEE